VLDIGRCQVRLRPGEERAQYDSLLREVTYVVGASVELRVTLLSLFKDNIAIKCNVRRPKWRILSV